MAKPRIFISSTYYDLKHIRASLGLFIDSLGYESILFEKGQIAFVSDDPLDISCYREAETADIFVLIIGGRYGAEVSNSITNEKNQYTDYNSITKKEYETASKNHIPTYILIEKGVYAEYQTYKNNRENTSINYAHVDNINIFKLIDEIHNKPNNNPIFSFEKYNDIEAWLREQWSGLFKDFLIKRNHSKKFESLQSQVTNLETLNETFKTYLETLLKSSKESNNQVIRRENDKLELLKFKNILKDSPTFSYILDLIKLDNNNYLSMFKIIKSSKSLNELFHKIYLLNLDFRHQSKEEVFEALYKRDDLLRNEIRELYSNLDLPLLNYEE